MAIGWLAMAAWRGATSRTSTIVHLLLLARMALPSSQPNSGDVSALAPLAILPPLEVVRRVTRTLVPSIATLMPSVLSFVAEPLVVYQVPFPAFRRTSGFRVNGLKLPFRPHSYVPRQSPSVDSDGRAGSAAYASVAGGMPSLAFIPPMMPSTPSNDVRDRRVSLGLPLLVVL